MTRTLSLVDSGGELATISLISTGATGIIGLRGRLATPKIGHEQIHQEGPVGDVMDSYSLNLLGSSQDNSASQIQALAKMLRKARAYFTRPYQNAPVYLQAQHGTETGIRYAIVKGAPGISLPDFFDSPFEAGYRIENFGLDIVREHPWRGAAPGTLPAAETLTKTDGSVDKASIFVSAFEGTQAVTHVFNYDSSLTSYSANLLAGTGAALWPATAPPAVNDAIYIGAPKPWHHFVVPVGTAGNFSATVVVEAYIGGAWVALTEGSAYTWLDPNFTQTSVNKLFHSTGEWVLSLGWGAASMTSTAINGATNYWIRLRLSAVSSWTTHPYQHSSETFYTPRKNYLAFGTSAIKGDAFPRALFRWRSPYGHSGTSPNFSATSRIVMGGRSRDLSSFKSSINVSNLANDGLWTVAAETGDSLVDYLNPAWGCGYGSSTTFGSSASMVARVTMVGANLMDDYRGLYRVFFIVRQNAGAAGDTSVKLRFMAGTSGAGAPFFDTPIVASEVNAPSGFEVKDMGIVQLPFTPTTAADSLSQDLIIQIWASRDSGAATQSFAQVVLIPVDEFYLEVDDNVDRDSTSGGPALRGNTGVDIDFGVLDYRTVKVALSGTGANPTIAWGRSAGVASLRPGVAYRIFCLPMHYGTGGWGGQNGPLLLTPGGGGYVSMHIVDSFLTLRGAG